jgi:multiple sugar transport system permease protein
MKAVENREEAKQGFLLERIHQLLERIDVREKRLPWIFLGPAVFLLALLTIYPILHSLWLSLHYYRLGDTENVEFVGLENYMELAGSGDFHQVIVTTLTLVTIALVVEFILGFVLALTLNHWGRGKQLLRTILLIPMMITPCIVAFNFRLAFNFNYGLITYLMDLVGMRIPIISDARLALFAIILTDAWEWTPFMFVVILAGLAAIPEYMYEAAEISGATRIQRFRYVTLPSLKGVILVGILIRIMDLFKLFDLVFIMTEGGPGINTATLSYWSYRLAFKFFRFGQGGAVAIVTLAVVVAICFVLNKIVRKQAV